MFINLVEAIRPIIKAIPEEKRTELEKNILGHGVSCDGSLREASKENTEQAKAPHIEKAENSARNMACDFIKWILLGRNK